MTMMTPTLAILTSSGYQGGTLTQAEHLSGLTALQIVELDDAEINTPDYLRGLSAIRRQSMRHNKMITFPQNKGNLEFWKGVVDGMREDVVMQASIHNN